MTSKNRSDEIVSEYCAAIRQRPGKRPSMRSLAATLFMATSSLYDYVASKAALELLAEGEAWRRLDELLADVPVEDRLDMVFAEAPGWLWLISDLTVDHAVVERPVALVASAVGATTSTDEACDWMLGVIGCNWVHSPDPSAWRRSIMTGIDNLDALLSSVADPARNTDGVGLVELLDATTLRNKLIDAPADADVRATIDTLCDAQHAPSLREISRSSGIPMSSLHDRKQHGDLASAVADAMTRIFIAEVEQHSDLSGQEQVSAACGFWCLMARSQPGLCEFMLTAPNLRMIDGVAGLVSASRSNDHSRVTDETIAALAFGMITRLAKPQRRDEANAGVASRRVHRLIAATTSA